ncbi:MAG: hypothetical protein JO222_00945, partial [Frankiales bacterium]|nr:hypothetical protein [Frankiales bacterium]
RQLCNVISAAHRGGVTTLTLVGVDVDPSLVVSNIVIGLGDTGQSVTLVCAGEAAESTAALVGCPRGPGLTEVLRNGMLLRDAVLRSPLHRGVQVLRPGSDADWVVDHARPAAVAALLDELRRSADLVIVQSPTSEDSGVAGAQLFAGVTDASLPLIALDETRHDQFLETLLQLSRVGARVMGAVTVHGTADPQRVAASLPPPPASRPRETDPVLPKLAGEPERPAAAASSSPATPKVEPIATPESTEPSNARIIDRPSALDATAPRPSGPLHASTIPTLPSVERRGGLNPAGSGPAERALTDDRGDRADDQAGERTAPVDRDDDTAATTTDTDSDTGGDASREATDHRPVDSALENLRTHFDGIDRSP